eukprot:NODE_2198_length_1177_cov_4.622340_g1820_i0.p1 GENE.NODE_2198_length_1177_cov_4.622340_g1820_i0~~NODE_2198_length_1177_cov_4.622340_g1820_i0.p1  ORF type:complete len:121 (-),score=0.95 NODE_2198_length_1177_cov_4.622340_g1820_i0:118-480(-)
MAACARARRPWRPRWLKPARIWTPRVHAPAQLAAGDRSRGSSIEAAAPGSRQAPTGLALPAQPAELSHAHVGPSQGLEAMAGTQPGQKGPAGTPGPPGRRDRTCPAEAGQAVSKLTGLHG